MSAATLAAASAIGSSLTGFAPTNPAEGKAIEAVAAVQQVAPGAISGLATTVEADADTAVKASTAQGVAVEVPKDPAEGLYMASPADVPDLRIGLPFADQASEATRSQKAGVAVYDNNNGSSTIPVVHQDGSVQISTVIQNADAPRRYDYHIDVPEGQALRLAPNGGAFVGDDEGNVSISVGAPWAKDANGKDVATRYEVNGNTLTQVVDFTAATAFPVVADPTVTWLWWGRTVKYTRAETKQVVDFAGAAQMFSYLCILGGLAGAACTTVANLGFQIVKNAASNAYRAGRCLQINIPYVGPGLLYDVTC